MSRKEEISFKEMLHTFKEWFRYLVSKWIIILVIGLTGGILGYTYAYFSKPTYSAKLSFILANASSSPAGLLGLANQFGVDVSGSSDNVFNGDNIIALMKSRKMVEQALFKTPANNKNSLINLYCVDAKLNEAWEKISRLKNAFPFPDAASQMTPVQDSLFREIYTIISIQNLDILKPEDQESIYTVTTTFTNETLAYYLAKYIVDATSAFYIDTKTKVSKGNLDMLQHEADSLRSLLGSNITSAAAQNDETFNLNPAYQVKRSQSQQSEAQITVVGTAYGEVVKNLEIAKITLQKDMPLYQIIDEPHFPLVMIKKSKLIYLIGGAFLAGFMGFFFLIIRKLLNEAS